MESRASGIVHTENAESGLSQPSRLEHQFSEATLGFGEDFSRHLIAPSRVFGRREDPYNAST